MVRPSDLASIVGRTVESLDVLDQRSILVQTEPVTVPVDAPKIERIVENLVMNAVRHTDPDVGIWVRVWPQDGGAVIAVEDDGPGVPLELRHEIFEPFRQGPTSSAHAPGTGIGLSLVAMFADLHGGRAWVEDREGGGASFRVFLPGDTADHRTGNGQRLRRARRRRKRGRGLDFRGWPSASTTLSSDVSTSRSSRRTGRPPPRSASRPGSRFGSSGARTTASSRASCARVRCTPCARRRCARTSPSAGRSARRRS